MAGIIAGEELAQLLDEGAANMGALAKICDAAAEEEAARECRDSAEGLTEVAIGIRERMGAAKPTTAL